MSLLPGASSASHFPQSATGWAGAECRLWRGVGSRLALSYRAFLAGAAAGGCLAIDDHTRIAYCEILHSERKEECAAFLRRACAWYREQGFVVERVLTDNAKAYHSHFWRDTCAELQIERRYTRPYSPWTNRKAEALIKTLLREWAYRFAYPTSAHRSRALSGYLRWYNRRRPHGSLGARPPISRVSQVCGQYG